MEIREIRELRKTFKKYSMKSVHRKINKDKRRLDEIEQERNNIFDLAVLCENVDAENITIDNRDSIKYLKEEIDKLKISEQYVKEHLKKLEDASFIISFTEHLKTR